MVGANALHTAAHIDTMDCQVCHAQPYKNCFECHTDLTETGVPFYSISDHAPDGNHDHLMTFRAGKNPKHPSVPAAKKYAVLRHVPVDPDVFTYTGNRAQPGLLPAMVALPTWKYATPHNIVRVTPIQSSCANCHGQDYTKFWLTDPVVNAEGWVSPANEANEQTANSGLVIGAPLPTTGSTSH
jgi:thiosulfate/3-mercaptopyruvate sulfurtransferase